jgi:general secretion pathway protein B
MSFILDALKKSESDRQRQSGPALFEVKVAPRRTRLPLWALALALLLAVNLVILGWMLLRHPAARADATLDAAPNPNAPAAVAGSASAPLPTAAPVPTVPAAAASPPPAVTAVPASAAPTPVATAPNNGAEADNPEDLAPAAEPAAPLSAHVRRGTADGVPLYQEWAASSGASLPQLRLDLHVYAARPEERFVMINMHKLREGDTLPEGVHVENITPEGAVLSYNGARFLLPRD